MMDKVVLNLRSLRNSVCLWDHQRLPESVGYKADSIILRLEIQESW
ncbi:MAG: hypothetical protein RMY34_24590 [Aulosira sp. DedQUE10]|nr:hypothetical protein [Aulosira sp. DedQUE10]